MISKEYQYKQSGVDWLGEIPNHWKVDRIKDVFSERDEQLSKEFIQKQTQVFHYSIPAFDVNQSPEIVSGDEISSGKKVIRNGQLLFSKLNCWKPRVWLIEDIDETRINVGSTEFVILNPWHEAKVERRYFKYLISSKSFIDIIKTNLKSVTNSHQRIQPNDLLTTMVPLPLKQEQTAIADYLDKACGDIDKVIQLKEEQFVKAEKLLFSFLDEMFTGDHTVSWVEERLKDITKINPSVEEDLTDDTLVTIVPMECVTEMGDLDASEVVPFKDAVSGLNYFRNGDVLFAKITPCMENGKGAFVENLTTNLAFGSTEYFVVRPSSKILGKFIYYYTRAERYRLEAEANMKGAAGQQRVTPRFFNGSIIRYPKTIKDQEAVIVKIDAFRKRNENLLQLLRDQINTLTEYKKSLIHEVVTGKKQVYFEEGKTKSAKPKPELTAVA